MKLKSIVRRLIPVVMVGMFVLMLCGQTQNDAVVAQGRKPVMMYRYYDGPDGLAHFEKIEVKNFNENDVASLMAITGAEIHRNKPAAPGAALGRTTLVRVASTFSTFSGMNKLSFRAEERLP